jgi:anti-sigma factor ChrR (cupin superfamily)
MPRFAKHPDCPTSATLQAYGADTLSFLARPGVATHLAACEFCGAELALLTQPARAVERPEVEPPPPAMPLALLLFAQSALADMAAARNEARRAA